MLYCTKLKKEVPKMKTLVETLRTKTKVGYIEHPFSYVSIDGLKKLTFDQAYAEFIDVLYGEGKAVVHNGKAVILYKKTAYVAVIDKANPLVVLHGDWKKIENLRHEFKLLISIG